jgi:hypothetical protein
MKLIALLTIVRIVITYLCVYTLSKIIAQTGYSISFDTLLAAAILVIVGVRVWCPLKFLEDKDE